MAWPARPVATGRHATGAYAVLSSAVIPALPTIQRDLHTSETGVTWVLTGFLLSATFIVDHQANGFPSVTGFTETFVMATGFLIVCIVAGVLIPGRRPAPASLKLDAQLATNPDTG